MKALGRFVNLGDEDPRGLLNLRKRQEEGSCEPSERGKGVRAQTLSESQLQPPR